MRAFESNDDGVSSTQELHQEIGSDPLTQHLLQGTFENLSLTGWVIISASQFLFAQLLISLTVEKIGNALG